MKENRIVFVDYLRMVACFLVMLVHASENFYAADASGLAGNVSMLANEQNRFWVAFYDGTLGRISVPLFMLASAFLLVPLKPGVSMVDFYKRRFKRVLPPMIVFMLLYTFLPLLWGQMTWEQSWTDFTMLPFTFPSMAGHLWFCHFDTHSLACALCEQRPLGYLLLEPLLRYVLLLLRLPWLSGDGPLHQIPPFLGSGKETAHWHYLPARWSSIHRMVVLACWLTRKDD